MMRVRSMIESLFLSAVLVGATPAGQETTSSLQAETPLTGEWLVIEPVGKYPRAPVHVDPMEAEIVAGRWSPPKAGDTVTASDGKVRTWTAAKPADDGWLRGEALKGGYACWTVESDQERFMLLDAVGHSLVYVNGEIRAGDPYGTGWVLLPVRLQAGRNTFLFSTPARSGELQVRLTTPKADAMFNPRDMTLPDLIRGEGGPFWGALPVINTTGAAVENLRIESAYAGTESVLTSTDVIAAWTAHKLGFQIAAPPDDQQGDVEVTLKLIRDTGGTAAVLDTAQFKLAVRDSLAKHKRTFISEIDGSVQYYAVTPATPDRMSPSKMALFLSLHGASVEATNQANAYNAKDWGHVVAPTNWRPYGFDWEDWGRLDALEVLKDAQQHWEIDPQRIYLTGHSMGGHGTWQVGVQYPDLFAAIGPSAAWPDFWSYAGAVEYKDPTAIEKILERANLPGRTQALARNYLHYGVYILHGDQDDNVPVKLGREMRELLGKFHPDFAYYERPGAGHWWGNECVDWPPMFEFFGRHTKPPVASVRHIEFHTASPGVSATCDWVSIEAQAHPLEVSSATIDFDPQARKFSGKTENVARLSLDLTELSKPRQNEAASKPVDATVLPADKPLTVELDGKAIEGIPWPADARVWLSHEGETWKVAERPSPNLKNPRRYGPFKEVFCNRFVLVYGTKGTPEENAAAYNKARYDAETFWYRGNGAADVIPDAAFDATKEPDRNMVLYGNADTNTAWRALLGDSPVQIQRGAVRVGDRQFLGDGFGCLLIRPRPGSDVALVGVVAGTGVPGLRLLERLPYFVSGVGFPDCLVVDPEILAKGTAGICAAGFFGLDWSVESGDFAW